MTSDLKQLLATDTHTLRTLQYNKLREFVVQRLHLLAARVEDKEYNLALSMLAFSPAGDGMGSDNHYLDFSDVLGDWADLHTAITKLKVLSS